MRWANLIDVKYVKDYRIDLKMKKDGKQKRRVVYVGPLFSWKSNADTRKKCIREGMGLLILGWMLYFASIWKYSRLSHVWYVWIPYVCFLICATVRFLYIESLKVRKFLQENRRTTERISGSYR